MLFTIVVIFSKQSFAQYNYLCDFDTKFTTNSVGQWSAYGSTPCQIAQLNRCDNCGSVAWLGDIDANTLSWTDYTIESTIALHGSGNSWAGIIFRATEISDDWYGGSYYFASIVNQNFFSTIQGDRVSNTKFSSGFKELNGDYKKIDSYTDYTLRVEVSGNSWIVFIDEEQVTSGTDSEFSAGSIGLRTYGVAAAFKTLYITRTGTAASTATSAPTVQPSTTSQPTNRFVFMF